MISIVDENKQFCHFYIKNYHSVILAIENDTRT